MSGIDHALHLLERRLPPGWHVTSIEPSQSHGSRDPDGAFMDYGWYVATLPGWCVTVEPDGWEGLRDRWFQWGSSIRDAALRLAWSIRRTARRPHLIHLGLEGPGEVTFEHHFVHGCAECEAEAADLFGGLVEWQETA